MRFRAPAHHAGVTSRIGTWLGIAFGLCFLTGLISHGVQHDWPWPARPAGLYRVTQGVHVLSGVASIPLLLAKLWSVYPKLFERPPVRNVPHALERGSILVLVAAAFFELVTGLFNAAQNYPWPFYFPTAHYAVAWIVTGALLVHIAVKIPVIRRSLEPASDERTILSRRAFLRTTALTAGVAVVTTAGVTVPWLRKVSVLAWRSDGALPVNRTAKAANVVVPPDWRLKAGGKTYSLAELRAMPQTTVELPIACVEGWSQNATWTGVRVADLVSGGDVRVESLEKDGLYRASTLPEVFARDPLTLLALRLDGEELSPDHGYPCRLIAPNRPGVLQTKWVTSLEIL
ncbi:Tat (twin-arginine translocation) pathway signal sequence [Lentzea fradiae]|uniref:Tat (Twin-arginine translocation) pathway signal sequence n=1 Tax=Lentzea fradiae TaxID=200378 RepID=A0A1G7P9B4_9PSEU|nr:molybdopterin-dependent oxidoreductase [Lentzea fradiae]SDF82868.1 Tat (twin-arginine translocation) pathway signal sequence [Lentzea fradiae]